METLTMEARKRIVHIILKYLAESDILLIDNIFLV